jgi:hypothetical protein
MQHRSIVRVLLVVHRRLIVPVRIIAPALTAVGHEAELEAGHAHDAARVLLLQRGEGLVLLLRVGQHLSRRAHPQFRDKNRRGTGKSQSKWTAYKMETPGSPGSRST